MRLRGVARIDAQGVRGDGGDLIVRGTLTDDAGAPLADGPLTISIARTSSPTTPLALSGGAAGPAVRSCGQDPRAARAFSDGVHVAADGGGRFCVRVSVPIDAYTVHIGYPGSGYVDPGASDVQVDLARRTCTLAFTPPPRVILLDTTSVALDATATLEGESAGSAGAGLPLTLSQESEGANGASEAKARGAPPLRTATTDVTGHARFTLSPSELGPVGRGTLRLDFAGNGDAPAATRVAEIERRAQVELDVPDAEGGKLGPGAPEEGVSIEVRARAAGAPVKSGSVEARVGDAIVGAAPVEDAAKAFLTATFGLPESIGASGEVGIALRYVPNVPWSVASAESSWRLPVRGRSPFRQGWVLLGALAVAAWFIVARAQRAKAMVKAPARPRPNAVPRRSEARRRPRGTQPQGRVEGARDRRRRRDAGSAGRAFRSSAPRSGAPR